MTTISYGLAYEYELAGKQQAAASGYAVDAPSLRGCSAIASIGLNYKERPDSRFSMGINLNGYAGKRQGIGFNVDFKWLF
jgi:hypothetical protein